MLTQECSLSSFDSWLYIYAWARRLATKDAAHAVRAVDEISEGLFHTAAAYTSAICTAKKNMYGNQQLSYSSL